jgi:hypothetical protein
MKCIITKETNDHLQAIDDNAIRLEAIEVEAIRIRSRLLAFHVVKIAGVQITLADYINDAEIADFHFANMLHGKAEEMIKDQDEKFYIWCEIHATTSIDLGAL